RAVSRCRDRRQTQLLRCNQSVQSSVDSPVVRKPLHRLYGLASVKTIPDCLLHELWNVSGLQSTRGCHKRKCFTVMAIQSKSNLHQLSAPAANLQNIAAPALVRAITDDASQVRSPVSPTVLRRQLQTVHLHHPAY